MKVNRKIYRWMLFLFIVVGWNCSEETHDTTNLHASFVYKLQEGLMHVVSEDLFPPPVASRIYAYTYLAGYEALAKYSTDLTPFSRLWEDLTIDVQQVGDPRAAYLAAVSTMAKKLVYRDHLVDELRIHLSDQFFLDTLSTSYQLGSETGEKVANEIIAFARHDGYNNTRTAPKYVTNDKPESWEPTAPTFGEALEPYWGTLRPFFLDSGSQFQARMNIEFDTVPDSEFHQQALDVQGYVARADEDSVAVAVYWDCNPGPTKLDGHFMQVRKQNTPGGHWLGITAQMVVENDYSLEQSAYLMALVSMGIADGFICAWDTKYKHDLLRPETYINRYIDSDWKPKLESPLFPEYSSAHSIISAVSASILTSEVGDQVHFIDSTNVHFGYPPRSFDSFWEAAREAATSRLLGGIHYPFACNQGVNQGKQIGAYILSKVDTLSSFQLIPKPKPLTEGLD